MLLLLLFLCLWTWRNFIDYLRLCCSLNKNLRNEIQTKHSSDLTGRLCWHMRVISCNMSLCHLGHPSCLALAEHATDFSSCFLYSFLFWRNQNALFLPSNPLSCFFPNKNPQETNSSGGPVLWNIHKDVSHCYNLGENPAISHSPCSYLVKRIQLKLMVKHLLEFYPATLMEPGCQPLNFGTLQQTNIVIWDSQDSWPPTFLSAH